MEQQLFTTADRQPF